ncbi:MAG: serine phosphatase [Bryobacterales bacterium]|nr:serine phosphatase [Bryobacterales bacterium]
METPALIVVAPNGHRSRVDLHPVPFRIGRQADNDLVVRDSRTSRWHARIVLDNGEYHVEDSGSRHGVFVNGQRVQRRHLQGGDRIEFGVPDSYQVIFTPEGSELSRLVESVPASRPEAATEGIGANLVRLKAVLEIARTLQTSYSLHDVLNSVVDAALAVTGAERGFVLLQNGKELEVRCARDCACHALSEDALRVPRGIIRQALKNRRDLLSMSFQPPGADGGANDSVADLELRSVICIPLIRIQGLPDAKEVPAESPTAGLIYMDSRYSAREMAAGDRELLQSLAIEASVIIENARLLEEEREKRKTDEELRVARTIQQSLLPRNLPRDGWFRAAGSSVASLQVGGDHFDIIAVDDGSWAALLADVSGKGVSAALVAGLLQGAFFNMAGPSEMMVQHLSRVNRFLMDRLEAGKYATVFFAVFDITGLMRYVNAGHCVPFLVSSGSRVTYLETTGSPLGLLEDAEFGVEESHLNPGDKLVIYSDGVTDAQDPAGNYFGRPRLRQTIEGNSEKDCTGLHAAIQESVAAFTEGAPQPDDVTLLVLEFRPAS